MFKKIGMVLAILAILLVIGVIVAVIYIDAIAKSTVEYGAGKTLGVPTTVEKVNIGIFSGQAGLSNLTVSNPSGFSGLYFMKLNQGSIGVSLGSLMEDVAEISHLELTGIELYMEKKGSKSNYQTILDNLKGQEKQEKQAPPKAAKKFVIRELAIRDVTVQADVLPIGGPLTIKVPEIILKNVGSDGSGVSMEALTDIVMKATLASVFEAGKGILPEDVLKDLGNGLAGLTSLASDGVKVAGELGSKIGDLGQGATKAVGDVANEAGKAVDDLGKGLGDLFGGKKEEPKK